MQYHKKGLGPYLIYLLLFSIFLGILVWSIDVALPAKYIVSGLTLGGAGCGTTIYDKNGKAYHFSDPKGVDYKGPSPMYSRSDLGVLDDSKSPVCDSFPDQIPASEALKGKPLYPLVISASTAESRSIRSGESISITTTVDIPDRYPGISQARMVYTASLTETESFSVSAKLLTTSFEYAPDISTGYVSRSGMYQQTWILSPKENTLGNQSVGLDLDIDERLGGRIKGSGIVISLEVRPLIGLSPTILALIAGGGAFLLGVLNITKLGSELWAAFFQSFKKSSQSTHTSRNRKR